MDRDTVLSTVAAHAATLRGFGVCRLGLFGSMARGEAGPGSDLDFVVELAPKTFDGYMDTKFYLERLFGRPVDLVLLDAIKPRLRGPILTEAVFAAGL